MRILINQIISESLFKNNFFSSNKIWKLTVLCNLQAILLYRIRWLFAVTCESTQTPVSANACVCATVMLRATCFVLFNWHAVNAACSKQHSLGLCLCFNIFVFFFQHFICLLMFFMLSCFCFYDMLMLLAYIWQFMQYADV